MTGTLDLAVTSATDPGTITIKASYRQPLVEAEEALSGNSVAQTAETAQTPVTEETAETAQTPETEETAGAEQTADVVSPGDTQLLSSQTTILSRDDLHLSLSAEKEAVTADMTSVTRVNAQVLDAKNEVVQTYYGKAKFTLLQPNLGKLMEEGEQIVSAGKSSTLFQAGNLSGEAAISVTVNGFEPATLKVQTLPKSAKKIVLESSSMTFDQDSTAGIEITAKLYDEDQNFVETDSQTKVTFALTPGSSGFASLDDPAEIQVQNGVAKIMVHGKDLSGPVNILASSPGLETGVIQLTTVTKFNGESWKSMAPNTLFASLLGADYGNATKDHYLGGWFVFSGKAESAISLVSDPKPRLRLE